MKNITLVTGGTGFIGSHLVEALVKEGRKVRCLVRKTSDTIYLKSLGVELIYGDLLDKESLKKAVKNVNVIYHLAAKVRPHKIISRLREFLNAYQEVNVVGTKNLVEASLAEEISKFIYFSSIAAAGPGVEITENFPCRPITNYGKIKFEAEKYLLNLFRTHKFPVLIIRPALIYGPRGLAILILSRFIKKGIFPSIGNGCNLTPVCYVDDLIRATLLAKERGKVGDIYFIVEKSYMVKELGEVIAQTLRKDFYRLYVPKNIVYTCVFIKEICERISHLKFSPFCIDLSMETILSASTNWTFNNDKAKNELGFTPTVDLKEGIEKTINWYKKNGMM